MSLSSRRFSLHPMRYTILKLASILLLVSFAQGCATNPVTGKTQLAMSESWEINAGAQYHQQILKQYQLYDDPELQAYVNDIGQKLAAKSERPDLNWTFTLLDSPEVNAFALPGGYVYITRGIMAYMNRESHLAGVIGHEIGHVTARHGAQRAAQQQLATVATVAVAVGTGSGDLAQASQMLGGALMSGYGRTQELQSDELGAKYIAQNNYDPEDMIGVIGILKDQELFNKEKAQVEGREVQSYHGVFASHPKNDTRLQGVIKAAEQYRDTSQPLPDDGRFLQLTDGMVFGESESQGITRGNRFYHKDLDLFLSFPDGWLIYNQPSELIGVAPDKSQLVRMRMAPGEGGGEMDDFLRSNFQGFRQSQRIQLDDGIAYAGVATLVDQNSRQQQNILVSGIQRADQRLVLIGQGSKALPNQSFLDTVRSVRGLKSNEQALATESKIRIVTAEQGDSIARLARQSSLSNYAEQQIRLINNMYPDGEPVVGQKIKIID